MVKANPIPLFTSVEQFKAIYSFIRESVALICPDTGKFLSGNDAFWQRLGIREGEGELILLNIAEIPEEGPCKAVLFYKNEEQVVPMQVYPGSLLKGRVKLGVLSESLPADNKGNSLEVAEAEKKVLLNEVYHRVKNNLNIIISLLSLQINRITNQETRLLLLESKSRIFTLSLLQQNLYSSPRISEIEVGPYLQSLASSVLASFRPKDKYIRMVYEIEEGWLDVDTLTPLGLIAHECLSNAVLHAFIGKESGLIKMTFREIQDNLYQLQIIDNGKGLPNGKEVADYTTLGFMMVKSLGKQLNAKVEMVSDPVNGTSVAVQFKGALK